MKCRECGCSMEELKQFDNIYYICTNFYCKFYDLLRVSLKDASSTKNKGCGIKFKHGEYHFKCGEIHNVNGEEEWYLCPNCRYSTDCDKGGKNGK